MAIERRFRPAGCATRRGPPAREAGGLLTIDLAALAANWRLLRERAGGSRMRRRRQGGRLRHRPRAGRPARSRRPAAAPSSSPTYRKPRAPAPACPDATIYVLNGLLPGTAATYAGLARAADPRLPRRRSTNGPRSAAPPARALPAALHVDTGMNRLGLRVEEALRSPKAARRSTAFEPTPADEPLRLRRGAGRSRSTRARSRPSRRVRDAFPGMPASLGNSSGIFLPRRALLRPRPPRLRPLRRQSDTRPRQSDASRGAPRGARDPGPRRRRRRERRLQRPVDRARPAPPRHAVGRLRRRLSARRERHRREARGRRARRRGDRRRPPLPLRRPRLDGPHCRRRDATCRPARSAAAISSP